MCYLKDPVGYSRWDPCIINMDTMQSIHILGVGKYFNYKSLHDNTIAKVCACVCVHVLVLFLVCLFLCLLQGEKQ